MTDFLAGDTVRLIAVASSFLLLFCGAVVTTRMVPDLTGHERILRWIYAAVFFAVALAVGVNAVTGPMPTPGVYVYAYVAGPLSLAALVVTALSLRRRP